MKIRCKTCGVQRAVWATVVSDDKPKKVMICRKCEKPIMTYEKMIEGL